MHHSTIKQIVLLSIILLSAVWSNGNNLADGFSLIQIKEAHVEGIPKGSTIQASINGHLLSVVFLENLGEVAVNVTDVTGYNVEALSIFTPNGVIFYIPNTGTYIVHFTLPNGDTYYGEFEVTD